MARWHGSITSNNFGNGVENLYQDRKDISSGINADHCRNSVGTNSHAEINRLSREVNSRISREMMNSVSAQIQRAINDAISNQVLPQIQMNHGRFRTHEQKRMERFGRETGSKFQSSAKCRY